MYINYEGDKVINFENHRLQVAFTRSLNGSRLLCTAERIQLRSINSGKSGGDWKGRRVGRKVRGTGKVAGLTNGRKKVNRIVSSFSVATMLFST